MFSQIIGIVQSSTNLGSAFDVEGTVLYGLDWHVCLPLISFLLILELAKKSLCFGPLIYLERIVALIRTCLQHTRNFKILHKLFLVFFLSSSPSPHKSPLKCLLKSSYKHDAWLVQFHPKIATWCGLIAQLAFVCVPTGTRTGMVGPASLHSLFIGGVSSF